MRIGIFTEVYTPYISGVVTSEVMLKKALEKLGHEVYVVTANLESFKYEYDEEEKVLRIPGISTGIYNTRVTSVYPVRAINKIKSWNLDVIHSQTEFGVGTFARIFAKQYKIPLVHTYHTMYEDYVYYITKGYFDKASKKVVRELVNFYCDKSVDELIVPTEKIYEVFKNKYKFKRDISVIPTGLEIERFYKENKDPKKIQSLRKKLNIDKKDFVILYVGRLAEEKQVDFLIESHKDLVKKHSNMKLVIAGYGPDEDFYRQYTKDMGLDKSVIFAGKVDWEDVPYMYQIANVFATPSKTETQGLTVIEAMASNLCPVCMKDEAFQSMITEELNGLFFETEEEYKKQILRLYDKPKELERFGKQARIQAETYGLKFYAERVLDVYRRAIREKKNKKRGIVSRIFRGKEEN